MRNGVPYEYTLKSISSPNILSAPSVDAAGGMHAAPHITRCPEPSTPGSSESHPPQNLGATKHGLTLCAQQFLSSAGALTMLIS